MRDERAIPSCFRDCLMAVHYISCTGSWNITNTSNLFGKWYPPWYSVFSPGDTADTISNDERSDIGEGLGSPLLLTSLIFAIPLVNNFNITTHAASEDRGQKMSRMEALDLGMALSPVTHWDLPNLSPCLLLPPSTIPALWSRDPKQTMWWSRVWMPHTTQDWPSQQCLWLLPWSLNIILHTSERCPKVSLCLWCFAKLVQTKPVTPSSRFLQPFVHTSPATYRLCMHAKLLQSDS